MAEKKFDLSQTATSKRMRKHAAQDLLIAIAAVIVLTSASIVFEIELVEFLYHYSRDHEDWELDEVFVVVLWIALAAVTYGYRRLLDIKRLNAEVASHAYLDPITNLPNRVMATENLEQMIARAKRQKGKVAVLFLDFDKFKMVNDKYGHANGDILIRSVADRLQNTIRQEDTVARLGGDEFLILLDLCDSEYNLMHAVTRIIECQSQPHALTDVELMIRFSIGIALFPEDGRSPQALMKAADVAMYQAKRCQKGGFHFYSSDIGHELAQRYHLESGLETAIDNNELSLLYQPKVDVQSSAVIGYEALLRWKYDGQMVGPDVFIPIAEESGLINKIGLWVLSTSLLEAKSFITGEQRLSVNMSAKQLHQDDFVEQVIRCLLDSHFPAHQLELEITETALMLDFESSAEKLGRLQSKGVNFAIDDFGTGYSCLSRLRDLPVDTLKIDKSFVLDASKKITHESIILAIVSMAQALKLNVVVEGIETAAQLGWIKGLGCTCMQGYYFAKPTEPQNVKQVCADMFEVQSARVV